MGRASPLASPPVRRSRAAAALALCVASLATWSVSAQPPRPARGAPVDPAVAEARELFQRGVEMAHAERWAEALELFRRSEALVHRPTTLFNIASTLFRLGRSLEALRTVDAFLASADAETAAADREDATRLRADVEASLANVVLRISPPEAEVRIDGQLVEGAGELRSFPVDPGAHAVLAQADGYEPLTRDLAMLAGERREEHLELRPRAAELVVTSAVRTSEIEVDGQIQGRGEATLTLEPGTHRVRVTAEDREPFELEATLVPGERRTVEAALVLRERPLLHRPWFWAIVGSVVVVSTVTVLAVTQDWFVREEPPFGGTTGIVLTALTTGPR